MLALVVSVRKGPPLRMLATKYRFTGNPAVTNITAIISHTFISFSAVQIYEHSYSVNCIKKDRRSFETVSQVI